MIKHYKNNWKTYHIIFLIITLLISFPDVLTWKSPGGDPSWRYAINEFFYNRYVSGKDFVFTYGSLGFLVECLKIGHNILFAGIFWSIIWGAHGVFLYQLLFKEWEKGKQSVLTFIGMSLFLISCPSPEYYLVYVGLLGILLSMDGYKRDIYIFCFIFSVSLYIKFSIFILVASVSIIYLLLGYFQNKELYKYCAPRICLSVILMPLIYFIINGFSLSNFGKYIKGSIEIASGYISAMSTSQHDVYIIWIAIAAAACAVCLIMSIKCGMRNFMTISFLSICLLMLYKHGFVRADNVHFPPCMNAMLAFMSLALIFLDWNHIFNVLGKWKSLYITMFITVISILIIQNGLESVNIVSTIKNKVLDFPLKVTEIYAQKDTDISPLPSDITEIIGDTTVCIYPMEISYCISNELNFIPLATVQAYSAYTPYLDQITAEKFTAGDAPEHILLTLETIDGRWPFIECPQTWEAIRNNYFALIEENGIILLRHNDHSSSVSYESLGTMTQKIEDEIILSDADYIKVNVELNWKGKLAKMFWKIPEVDMTVYYADENASPESGRILLDLFSEGVEVGSIISHNNTEQLIDMINHEGTLSKVSSISLSGDGLAYYKSDITVEFFSTYVGSVS